MVMTSKNIKVSIWLPGICKGNCGRSGSRGLADSVTGRGSEVSLLCSGRLQLATYLAGDPKRKGWGSHCRCRSIYQSMSLVLVNNANRTGSKQGKESERVHKRT